MGLFSLIKSSYLDVLEYQGDHLNMTIDFNVNQMISNTNIYRILWVLIHPDYHHDQGDLKTN